MVAKDVDSNPIQYRTWVVNNYPDFDGYYYFGLKSGPHSLSDIIAYTISDDSVVADFNLPDPLNWKTTYKVLPERITDSQLAVIGDYVYLFGGNFTSKIYKANLNNPVDWEYTGYNLPTPLYGSQLAIIQNHVYLFGGNNGVATDTIYSALLSNPLLWTNHGSLLPQKLCHSHLCITDGYIYLLGGQGINDPTDVIFSASASDPLTWINTNNNLPDPLFGSHISIIDGYICLFGGMTGDLPTNSIYCAPTNDLSDWSLGGYLPYETAFGQFITLGRDGYLLSVDKERISHYNPYYINILDLEQDMITYYIEGNYYDIGDQTYFTKIFWCQLDDISSWELKAVIPGEVFQSQLAIIYDRLFMFGGNGSNTIFASDYYIKYKFDLPNVINYGNITRTLYQETTNPLDLYKVLGFPYWKTDY